MKLVRFAASAAAVLLTGAAVICFGATAAGANPGISVSPSAGLHDGQTVTVTGSGFAKNGTVYIVECKAGATSEGQCSFNFSDLSTVVVAKADASGNLRSPSPVLKTSFKSTDCTKVACEIAAHQTITFSLTAANTAVHGISFASATHPSTSHTSAPTNAHSTAAASNAASSAIASSSATVSGSSAASSAAASATTVTHATGASTVPASQAGSTGGAAQPSSEPTTAAAQTIKQKADNGGRYLLVGIIAVLAVLYIAGMAISGKRAAGR